MMEIISKRDNLSSDFIRIVQILCFLARDIIRLSILLLVQTHFLHVGIHALKFVAFFNVVYRKKIRFKE